MSADESVERHAATAPRAARLVLEETADHGDEHVIKLVEVALESHQRCNGDALRAGLRATQLIDAAP